MLFGSRKLEFVDLAQEVLVERQLLVGLGAARHLRLIEVDEETALRCKVSGDSPVSKLIIGEDEHIFIAYEIEYTGGVPQARPTKDEPIVAVIFVDEPTLLKACRNDEVIDVGGFGQLPILRSHRRAFLDYIAARDGAKQEVVVNV